jgi:hypothetical protein
MIESRPQSGVYLITRGEIATLHEPGNDALREQVEESFVLLYHLFCKYGSAGHHWFDLDEEETCRELYDRMEALRDHDPYWRPMAEEVDRDFRLREEPAHSGTTFGTIQWADRAADAILDRMCFLKGYPGLVQVMERLGATGR